MKMLLAATATIQFVGLCMLTENPQTTSVDVDIVLPRVEQVAMQSMRHASPAQGAARTQNMDSHTAIIAFKPAPGNDTTGWQSGTPDTLKPADQYQYVKLNGERLTVQVTSPSFGVNPLPVPGLPRVTNDCPNAQLRQEYQPPNYPKAASVLTASGGVLTACHPVFPDGRTGRRIDTRWSFQVPNGNPAILEITSVTGGNTPTTRTLKLNANNTVIIGNVPTYWLNSDPNPGGEGFGAEAAHYRAFYSMLDRADTCAPEPMPEVGNCGEPTAIIIGGVLHGKHEDKPVETLLRAKLQPKKTTIAKGNAARTVQPTPTANMETYSCSNSQYP